MKPCQESSLTLQSLDERRIKCSAVSVMCATEVNTSEPISDTFAATPALKFVRLMLSWAANCKPKWANASMIVAVFDISVAFFHGKVRKVRKVIHMVPPTDLRKEGKNLEVAQDSLRNS